MVSGVGRNRVLTLLFLQMETIYDPWGNTTALVVRGNRSVQQQMYGIIGIVMGRRNPLFVQYATLGLLRRVTSSIIWPLIRVC